ncbi:MAG: DUF4402 domain-containing protein [Bacteroidota bacterium]
MKNINKIFAIAIVALGFSTSAFAQSAKSASSTATLVTPLKITKTTDLDFGVVASSATAGTIAMNYNNGLTPSGGSYVISGTPTSAKFNVTGADGESISVSYPTTLTLTGVALGTLTLSSITADCGTTTTIGGGAKDIKFSSVLEIPANTVADTYTNATGLTVTVNYN